MQFINKFKYKRKGHRIIKAFIKDKWNNDIQRYVNLNYNELKRIKAFKYLLLKEQQGFCCYCMRKIPFNEVTLEHVMPHHLEDKKRKEEVKYFRKSVLGIYLFEIKRVGRITLFLGNELATVPIAVVCIALLVRETLTVQRYEKYSD